MGLGGTDAATWWSAILGKLGAPVNATTTTNLNAWAACEVSGADNNPFNTELDWPGSTDYLPNGVKNYATFQDGVDATVATMTQGNLSAIADALRSSADRATFAGVVGASGWGTNPACIGGASGVAPAAGSASSTAVLDRSTAHVAKFTAGIARTLRGYVWDDMWQRRIHNLPPGPQ